MGDMVINNRQCPTCGWQGVEAAVCAECGTGTRPCTAFLAFGQCVEALRALIEAAAGISPSAGACLVGIGNSGVAAAKLLRMRQSMGHLPILAVPVERFASLDANITYRQQRKTVGDADRADWLAGLLAPPSPLDACLWFDGKDWSSMSASAVVSHAVFADDEVGEGNALRSALETLTPFLQSGAQLDAVIPDQRWSPPPVIERIRFHGHHVTQPPLNRLRRAIPPDIAAAANEDLRTLHPLTWINALLDLPIKERGRWSWDWRRHVVDQNRFMETTSVYRDWAGSHLAPVPKAAGYDNGSHWGQYDSGGVSVGNYVA